MPYIEGVWSLKLASIHLHSSVGVYHKMGGGNKHLVCNVGTCTRLDRCAEDIRGAFQLQPSSTYTRIGAFQALRIFEQMFALAITLLSLLNVIKRAASWSRV